MPSLDFVDVSLWQGDIDWDALTVPAVVKATEALFVDRWWGDNATEGRRTGKLMGAYHFLDHRYDGTLQADTFLNAVQPLPGELLVFDWETDSTGTVPDYDLVAAFVAHVRERGHGDALRMYGNEWHAAHALQLEVPFWCAWYGDVEDKVRARDACAWQYSSDGQVPGIAGRVDVNMILDERWLGMPSAAEIAEAVWSRGISLAGTPYPASEVLGYIHAEITRPDLFQARLVAAIDAATGPASVELSGDEIARLAAALIAQIPK